MAEDWKCIWINSNGGRCCYPTTTNSRYCYYHLPMAVAGYTHETVDGKSEPANVIPINKPVSKKNADEHWRQEMERELKKAVKSAKPKGKFRSILWVEEDFPRNIEGIYFSSLNDYEEYVGQQKQSELDTAPLAADETSFNVDEFDEMPSTDVEYIEAEGKIHRASAYRQENWDMTDEEWDDYMAGLASQDAGYTSYTASNFTQYSHYTGYTSKKKPHMKCGTYQKRETIMHMRYAILRDKAGKYYAVWVSCSTDAQFGNIMEKLLTMQLPVGVTSTEDGRFHTSQPYKDYDDADWRFSAGGESFYNIRTRIDRAKDPNWIPPNWRMAAFEGKWDVIPADYQKKCREWFDKGCPGWWGTWHQRKSTERMGFSSTTKDEPIKDKIKEWLRQKESAETPKEGQKGEVTNPCRMTAYDGSKCGRQVNKGGYCDFHNVQLFGQPEGRPNA